MRLVVNNPNNLKINEMDVITSKVRAIVIYDLNVFLVNYNNILMFPGGKISKDETKEEAIIREIKEEIGININDSDIIPYRGILPQPNIKKFSRNFLENFLYKTH